MCVRRCSVCAPGYPEEVEATREREITDDSERTWLRQRAMVFPSPAAAEDFMARVQDHWGYCVGRAAAVDRHGEAQTRTLGSPGLQEGVLSVPDSASADTTADCSLALAAKSNIVVAVDLCGTAEPARAVAVAYAIRGRIPTDY
ncbi:sensor domain-containing protein [Mycolicibacterium farcinogenes]|nr:sensor domain-containing protein [Mycolicibacterium farcinogenes]